MTAPKLATSRPAALTGRVGHGGDNRVHDVALVQVLLGVIRGYRGQSPLIQFRTRAKVLYEMVAADLKARCLQAFAITDPVDLKIQSGLKHDLACVVRSDLEGVEALAQFLLAEFRKKVSASRCDSWKII